MMKAAIQAIEYHLPQQTLTSEDLARDYPEWSVEKIESKTGIRTRHVAAPGECASDLAVKAAQKLFESGACRPGDIDFLLLCTQTPDYFLPTTACLVQERLGIPQSAGALDINLGCSGYVFGLGLCQGLIETGQARNVLFLTADTYTKLISPGDRSTRTLFGDGAAATLVRGGEREQSALGPYVYGTDGKGAANLIVRTGGMRCARSVETAQMTVDEAGNQRAMDHLYMNGPEIFTFTMNTVPRAVADLLSRAGIAIDDVDLVFFHQANQFLLEQLTRRMRLPSSKVCVAMSHCGNTVSASIPIVLKETELDGRLKPGSRVLLVGFGVGYSWGAMLARW